MKKIIVILCIKLYKAFPKSTDWKYYHDILGVYISPAVGTPVITRGDKVPGSLSPGPLSPDVSHLSPWQLSIPPIYYQTVF